MNTPEKTLKWRQPEVANGRLTEEEVYAMVGFMLFRFHVFEKLLRICTAVIKKTAAGTHEEIHAIDSFWDMRRDTLGTLMKTIRGTVEIDLSFDSVLKRLVRRRNAFAQARSSYSI